MVLETVSVVHLQDAPEVREILQQIELEQKHAKICRALRDSMIES